MRRALLPYLLTALGVVLLGQGLWIPAKARLAQALLDAAWTTTREAAARGSSDPSRPWPWADTWPVARLGTPWGEQVVLAGAHGEALAFGPGWDERSSVPGRGGNVVLAGHRDTHFAGLQRLRVGDRLRMESVSGVRHYAVTGVHVTTRHDLRPLAATEDDRLTLITCYPFDPLAPRGPLRFVVRARAVDVEAPPD